ncbi:hypothetical protein AB1Y20_018120 [Prymnesium parvum]|uniref:Plastid lipid-associated protein/fibrillin conserved domain-containing protein n=1 Tax=Prymnesium parvum TaxID=97485 RepID=A0AB34JQR9_PRYPA
MSAVSTRFLPASPPTMLASLFSATAFVALPACPARFQPASRASALHHPPPRLGALTMASADEVQLLTECRQDERSLPTIRRLCDALSSTELPAKPKRELLGDWRLEFASDAGAVSPLTTGEIGQFAVIEGVVHRFLKDNLVETIEVARQFGPFGNTRRGLNGKWSLERSGTEVCLRWRYTYLIDEYGRERDPPKLQQEAGTHEVKLEYVSSGLILLSPGEENGEKSLLVLSRVPNLVEWLEENRVAREEEIKANAKVSS